MRKEDESDESARKRDSILRKMLKTPPDKSAQKLLPKSAGKPRTKPKPPSEGA